MIVSSLLPDEMFCRVTILNFERTQEQIKDNPLSDYSKNEIARNLAMSRATFFKYWKELERSRAVRSTREIGRATMYKLDVANDVVKQLIKLDMTIARKKMVRATEEYRRPIEFNFSRLKAGRL